MFSPLYAQCIALLGLNNSARLLTLLFTLWFLGAVWIFARALAGRNAAWAAAAFVLIIAGNYGGAGVFRILEPFLTARLPAQALIVTALYCKVRGMNSLGLALALGALLIHPLMALPGLLLIVCLWLPLRVGVIGAIAGVLATLAISVVAVTVPAASHILPVMDAPWLDVVRERSQFLFLQLWSIRDWSINALPIVCLGLTAAAIPDARIRKLCAAAALVASAGVAVAFIGSRIGPVAVLVQGQAWRWVWVAVLVSVALLPFTALQVARDEKCGTLCASLLLLGWILPAIDGIACVALASVLWLSRSHINTLAANFCRWLSAALGISIGVWVVIKCRIILSPPMSPSGRTPLAAIQDILALKVPAVLLCALIWSGLRITRTTWMPMLLSGTIAALSALFFPAAFRQTLALASTSSNADQFSDWAKVIPPTSTVLVTPSHDMGAFVWFTLQRPNYLTLDQSAGVVFSRATALEVRRRSQVLLLLMDPDWKILTRLRSQSDGGRRDHAATRPLTSGSLIQVCADPQLGFVISPEKVGFDPLPHVRSGAWKGWNLYDCREVRFAQSGT